MEGLNIKKELYVMDKTKNIIGKIVIFILAAGVLCLLLFFLKDIVFPFIKLEVENDMEGAKQLLLEKGVFGYITVSIIEALQMVVIFIPAEFIQLSSGMSYPWYIAIIFCDIGVLIGSSIIYFIVNVIKYNPTLKKSNSKIRKYEKKIKTNNTIILMYILFIMPIIPFGAICYWSSNKKIPYHKYVFTCATGVIPSIATSILMGANQGSY